MDHSPYPCPSLLYPHSLLLSSEEQDSSPQRGLEEGQGWLEEGQGWLEEGVWGLWQRVGGMGLGVWGQEGLLESLLLPHQFPWGHHLHHPSSGPSWGSVRCQVNILILFIFTNTVHWWCSNFCVPLYQDYSPALCVQHLCVNTMKVVQTKKKWTLAIIKDKKKKKSIFHKSIVYP